MIEQKTADVVVVGAGIVGCAAAYYMAKKGLSVLVLEQGSVGDGASCRNGGGVRQSARDVRELPLVEHSIQNIWPTLSEELGVDVEYHQAGNLRMARTPQQLSVLEKKAADCIRAGVDVQMLDQKQVQQVCPYLSDAVIGASWCPTDGHANPLAATLGYYRAARRLGVHFITGETAVRLVRVKGRLRQVHTVSGGVYEGDQVLVAAGFVSRRLLNSAGIDIPMFNKADECLITEPLPPMFWHMLGTAEGDFYGHQTAHGSFVFGGDTGLEWHYKTDDPQNTRSTAITVGSTSRAIMKYCPALGKAKVIRTWGGWCDKTPDLIPVIDKVDELPGLLVACGFSGHGFAFSPAVGTVLAQLAAGEGPCVEIGPMRYDRFDAQN